MDSITLSDLALRIKEALSSQLSSSYWVVAEIGEMKVNARGHCYLELVEKNEQQVMAKLRAAIWAYDFRNINQWFSKITGHPLKEGIKILANAQVSFHEIYGLNLTIRDIDPNFTLGERQRKKQEVINQLALEGLTNLNKQQALPLVPQRIAVVSSSTAAGYGDFCHQLQSNKNKFAVSCELFQVTLQGKDAAGSIIAALADISTQAARFDAVAIIRGGGATMDFDVFNEYEVCAAIARMPCPVLTGIGHERDETIADMVAHTRLNTPTAVAEFILEGFHSFADSLHWLAGRLQQVVDSEVSRQNHSLEKIKTDLQYLIRQQLKAEWVMQNEIKKGLRTNCRWILERRSQQLKEVTRQLFQTATEKVVAGNHTLANLETRMRSNDPKNILARGFTITKIDGQSILKADIAKASRLQTFYSGGVIESEISTPTNNE